MNNKRNPNIEVFRCLLMFLIVLRHAFIRGTWSYVPEMWTLLFLPILSWHVPAFISISGWFGIKFSWRKFINLVFLMAFYSLPYIFLMDGTVTGGWFGCAYLALMLISPIINAGVQSLAETSKKHVWVACGCFSVVILVNWFPVSRGGGLSIASIDQYSLVNMIFIYVLSRTIRLTVNKHIRMRYLALACLLYVLVIAVIGVAKTTISHHWNCLNPADWSWLTYYNAPHVWLMSISMLLLFVWHVRLPEVIGRIGAFLAPSMFGVYLLHEGCVFGQGVFKPLQDMLIDGIGNFPVIIIPLSALIVFGGCVIIDLARRAIVSTIKCMVSRALYRYDTD